MWTTDAASACAASSSLAATSLIQSGCCTGSGGGDRGRGSRRGCSSVSRGRLPRPVVGVAAAGAASAGGCSGVLADVSPRHAAKYSATVGLRGAGKLDDERCGLHRP